MYTSYFANIKKLPNSLIPVSISIKSPQGYNGLEYKKLAPMYKTLSDWKVNHDVEKYTIEYEKTVLNELNPNEVLKELKRIAGTNDVDRIVLVCYEKSDNFCHRHLVSKWFSENGIVTEEYVI